jgi:histidinol dehydrogenase
MEIRTIDLDSLEPSERSSLVSRSAVPDPATRVRAAEIVADVGRRGDVALAGYTQEFDGVPAGEPLRVPQRVMKEALAGLDRRLRESLEFAIANVRAVHESQRPRDGAVEPVPGVLVERRWSPLRRVGVYVPGGRAAYPSSLIMGVVPAVVALVDEIVVVSPAGRNGGVDPTVLAAACLLGVTEVYSIGGAQAIGALAHGTETIRRVNKIVGPGGPWVTAAKLAVYGACPVDLPAGPSEAAVVVDSTANPEVAAADLLCQAEHGEESLVLLVAIGDGVAGPILHAAERRVRGLARQDVIREALESGGLVVETADRAAALDFVDDWAPEHLSLHVADLDEAVATITAAGSVFVGHWSPESAGDYATGANHVLPTGGLAAGYGPLAVEDFGSWRQVQTLTETGLRSLAPSIRRLAAAEGLTAHAAAVDARLGEE